MVTAYILSNRITNMSFTKFVMVRYGICLTAPHVFGEKKKKRHPHLGTAILGELPPPTHRMLFSYRHRISGTAKLCFCLGKMA